MMETLLYIREQKSKAKIGVKKDDGREKKVIQNLQRVRAL